MQTNRRDWIRLSIGMYCLGYGLYKILPIARLLQYYNVEWIRGQVTAGIYGILHICSMSLNIGSMAVVGLVLIISMARRYSGKVIRWLGIIQLWVYILADILELRFTSMLLLRRIFLPLVLVVCGNILYKYDLRYPEERMSEYFPYWHLIQKLLRDNFQQ